MSSGSDRYGAPTVTASGALEWADGERIEGAHLCGKCGHVHGRLSISSDLEISRYPQDCLCVPAGKRVRAYTYSDLDICLELCRCCSFEPIRALSRWSLFFCEGCHPGVLAANRAFGGWVIPIGRHSMMHGLSLGADDEGSAERADAFAAAAGSLFERIGRLDEWRAGQVKRHLATLGLNATDLLLTEYVEVARRHPLDKTVELERLVQHFGSLAG